MKLDINRVKILVTIPVEDVDKIREVVCDAGAGVIGEYDYCTTSVKSIGTFRPSDNANPYIGTKQNLEFVEEEKLEFICDVDKVKSVLKALRQAHPYEEPAIDIVPLIDESVF